MKYILILLISFVTLFANNNLISKSNNDLIINSNTLLIKKGKTDGSVNNFLLNGIDPKSIKKLRIEKDKLIKEKNVPIKKDLIVENNVKSYKKGEVLTLNGIVNKPMVIEIFDKNKNNVKFKYIVSGSKYITIEQDKNQPNRIFVTPTQKYRTGTILIGTDVYDFPVELNIQENSDGYKVNSYTKIIMDLKKVNNILPVEERLKKAIFSEQINLNNFASYPKIDYELWRIKDGKKVFIKNAMKIYYVDNSPKKSYYIVLLNKAFKILGYDNLLFEKYSNEYNVYYLDFNINVFSIISKSNFESLNNEERLRVIIKN